VWPIFLLIIDAIITVGAFYYLSLGMPHQLSLVQFQAISVGAGAVIAAIVAFTLRGEEQGGNRPLWPMLLPLICAIFAMGIYYALMIGSPQVIDMLVLQGYSVGIGTLLIILISIPFWRGIQPSISFAGIANDDDIAEHDRFLRDGLFTEIDVEDQAVVDVGKGVMKIDKVKIGLGDISDIISAAIMEKVSRIVDEIETSNATVIGQVLDGVSGIDKLVAEYAMDRENARRVIDQAVHSMQAADEKMAQIKQALEKIRSAVAEKVA
jgi:hypothetical protein